MQNTETVEISITIDFDSILRYFFALESSSPEANPDCAISTLYIAAKKQHIT